MKTDEEKDNCVSEDGYYFLTPGERLWPKDEVRWGGEWIRVYTAGFAIKPKGFKGMFFASSCAQVKYRRKKP